MEPHLTPGSTESPYLTGRREGEQKGKTDKREVVALRAGPEAFPCLPYVTPTWWDPRVPYS